MTRRAGATRAAQVLDGLAARVSPALQFCGVCLRTVRLCNEALAQGFN